MSDSFPLSQTHAAKFGVLSTVLVAFLGQPAFSATFCVVPGGSGTCYPSISAVLAVAAANDLIQVGPGTYKEQIVIGKPVALIGAGAGATTIDASGLANGIYIDGIDHPKLSNVVVRGFTIQNANYEGILVTNASFVTLSGNHVVSNNKGLVLSSFTCPGLPDFETNEDEDCGEGLHLVAVDHSILANNTVDHNAGGILITDETGPSHDNLITGNTVTDNPNDCGITLASHAPAPSANSALSFGVYHNTISGNESSYNGLGVPGAGAGIGMFAPGPGTKNYGNVVINNQIVGNGLPGVTIHGHAPGQVLGDFMIVGNYISGNAGDGEDAATPGPTGINVFGVTAIPGVVISQNVIDNEAVNVAVKTAAAVQVHLNNFDGTGIGILNTAVPGFGMGTVDASDNWWGCSGGAGTPGCATVSGTGVLASSWLSRQLIPRN